MITETDEIVAVLDAAALRWPDIADNRSDLIRKVLIEMFPELRAHREDQVEARRQRIKANAGKLIDTWPENWREEMRAEWPE